MTTSSKSNILSKIGWSIMFLFAALITIIASRYLTLAPDDFFSQQKAVYMANTTGLLLHITGAMLALLLGPFQFIAKLRSGRFLPIHRWTGRIYLIGMLCGGIGGLYMSTIAYGGWFARLGFASLAVSWLFSGWMAYKAIRNKQTEIHRQWMIRNYALTFAGVTLRLWLTLFQAASLDFTLSYITMAWISWLPNLIVAEWAFNRIRVVVPVRRQPATD